MTRGRRRALTVDEHVRGVLAGDRAVLGRTITLVESQRQDHRATADAVLRALLPHTGQAQRVGISGVPGVGKSTFLESLGMQLVEQGHRVAVLAIDPSSTRTGGSILGDKTRMGGLSRHPSAFVRPSPSAGHLGGVHRKTQETMWICEAAGYDVILVETVGVGQGEISVTEMVDTFLVLMLAGAGDELQGIKKGILEMVDVLAVNKSDGAGALPAATAARQYESALRLMHPRTPGWHVPVTTCSGLTGEGLEDVWRSVLAHRDVLERDGGLGNHRSSQRRRWMWTAVEQEVLRRFRGSAAIASRAEELERQVAAQETTPGAAAAELVEAWLDGQTSGADDGRG